MTWEMSRRIPEGPLPEDAVQDNNMDDLEEDVDMIDGDAFDPTNFGDAYV